MSGKKDTKDSQDSEEENLNKEEECGEDDKEDSDQQDQSKDDDVEEDSSSSSSASEEDDVGDKPRQRRGQLVVSGNKDKSKDDEEDEEMDEGSEDVEEQEEAMDEGSEDDADEEDMEEENEEDDQSNDNAAVDETLEERKKLQGSVRKLRSQKNLSSSQVKRIPDAAVEKDVLGGRRQKNTRLVSKNGEDAARSNGDETYVTCLEDTQDRDAFFSADDEIAFKGKSPEKTPPGKDLSKEERSFLNTPNTYSSRRKSTHLKLNGGKNDPNQTTLDKYFPASSKSGSSDSDKANIETVGRSDAEDDKETVVPDSDTSVSDKERKKRVLIVKADVHHTPKEREKTETRSPKKLTPPPNIQKMRRKMNSETSSGKSKERVTSPKSVPRTRTKQLSQKEDREFDGSMSPVFHLTESQLSQVVTEPTDVVSESDVDLLPNKEETKLKDYVIKGIKEIRKSTTPVQSPGRKSKRQELQDSQVDLMNDNIGEMTPPGSPTSLMVVEGDTTMMGSKQDSGKEKSVGNATDSPSKQSKKVKSSSTLKKGKPKMQDASTAVSPPSAKKSATDFGNYYRMMAGIGLSTDSEADLPSSLEDFKVKSSKSLLQPRTLAGEFVSHSANSDNKQTSTRTDDAKLTESPVRVLRNHNASECSQASENASVSSPRRSQRAHISSTQVTGKPPIPNLSLRGGPSKPGMTSQSRTVRNLQVIQSESSGNSKHGPPLSPPKLRRSKRNSESSVASEHDLPLSAPKLRRSKRNSESSVASELSIPSSPKRIQRLKRASESSQPEKRQTFERVKRSKQHSESSIASDKSPVSPQRSATSSHSDKRTSERSWSGSRQMIGMQENDLTPLGPSNSQESGIFPLPESQTQERKHGSPPAGSNKTPELKLGPSQTISSTARELRHSRTLRSRSESGSEWEESSGITATQVLRRDIDMRKLRNARLSAVSDDDDEEEDTPIKPKMMKTRRQSSAKKRLVDDLLFFLVDRI